MTRLNSFLVIIVLLAFGLSAQAEDSWLQDTELPIPGCSRGLHIQVHDMATDTALSNDSLPANHRWLTLDISFENRTATDLIFDLGYPELLGIDSLHRQLFLLVNDRSVYRVAATGNGLVDSFRLNYLGASQRGTVTFPIPESGVDRLSLHYYHDHFGPVRLALLGSIPESTTASANQSIELQSNSLMEISLHDFELTDQWAGESAPTGMQWLVAEIHGRSFWQIDRPARAMDPDASIDARAALPKVLEYLEARGLLLAVVDHDWAFPRTSGLGGLPEDPVFLPDHSAGGTMVFAIPADAERVELVTYFPEFQGEGIRNGTLEPLRFTLSEGESSPAGTSSSLLVIDDSPVPFTVESAESVQKFGPLTADAGQKLLVLHAVQRNDSETGGMMRISHRPRLMLDGHDSPLEAEAAFNRGPVPLVEPFWLPAGTEHRRFTLVYRLPADATVQSIDYRGVSGPATKAFSIP